MSLAALLTLLVAVTALGPASGQSTLYSDGGCRITAFGAELNVSCTCNQRLRQTDTSRPINHLDITGCLADDPTNEREVRLAFLPPRGAADAFDFILPQVRSVNISQSRLRLDPVRGRPEAVRLPLRMLHIELGALTDGLPDGALQGLPRLQRLSLDLVEGGRAVRSALADLPRLEELVITNTHFQFVNTGLVTRVPRLRRLHFAKSQFDFMGSDVVVVESDSDGGDGDMDGSGNSTGECPSDDDDDDSFLIFSNMAVNTMNTNAIRVVGVRRLIAANNSIGSMYAGALNVSLRAPAGCRPLLRLTDNTLTDVRGAAVDVRSEGSAAAWIELGGNTVANSALSPYELRLRGGFERRLVPGLGADHFDCSCCECPGTRRMIETALQEQPSRLETDVFVAALAEARCTGGADRAFLEFADGCVPEEGLAKRVAELVPQVSAANLIVPLPVLVLPPLALAAASRG